MKELQSNSKDKVIKNPAFNTVMKSLILKTVITSKKKH